MTTIAWMPIQIDPEVCSGCNICVEVCPNDVLEPNPEKGKPPIVEYPDECGCHIFACIMDCPLLGKGAIALYAPYHLRNRIKRG